VRVEGVTRSRGAPGSGAAPAAVSLDGCVEPAIDLRRSAAARDPLLCQDDGRFGTGAHRLLHGVPDTTPEFGSEAALLGPWTRLWKHCSVERTHAMTRSELAGLLDHSILKPKATEEQILAGPTWCVSGRSDSTASSRAPSRSRVRGCRTRARALCRCSGFRTGGARSALKAQTADWPSRTERRGGHGLNVGKLKSVAASGGERDRAGGLRRSGIPVKVTWRCALDDEEKVIACRLVQDAGAAFVKTSTGFNPGGGATAADVRLMRRVVGPEFGVKAAGESGRLPMR